MRGESPWTIHQNRRRAAQALAVAAGSVLLLIAGHTTIRPLALAQEDDDSGHGRGRGRGRGGDDDSDASESEQGAAFTQLPAGSVEVRIIGDDAGDFVPGELTVDLGQPITFVNVHSDEHTATGSGFDTGIISDEGGMATVVLDTPGVFPYACLIHPKMTGVIRVRDASGVVPETQSSSQEIPTDAVTVVIANLSFDPTAVTVPTGTTVAWTNEDSVPHTVTAADGAFDSGIFDPGGSFAFTFNEPGSYSYVCQLHPQMQGTVSVEGDPAAGGQTEQPAAPGVATPSPSAASGPEAVSGVSVSIVDFAFEPDTMQVVAGDAVVWSNDGRTPHTVTGDFADSGVLDPGQTFSHTFETDGTFRYFCAIHPNMTASIQVGATQTAPDVAVSAASQRAAPDGVWLFALAPESDVVFASQQVLIAFHADGMLETDFAAAAVDGAPANRLISGHGEWAVRDGIWHIALAALLVDPEQQFSATLTIDGEGRLTADGATLQGAFTFESADPDGQSIAQGSGAFSGQPLPLDP